MDHGKTLHFNPPKGLSSNSENDPQAANSARERIAGLPSQYHAVPMPTKEEIANSFKPVSPAAEAKPLTPEVPSIESIRETVALKKPEVVPAPQEEKNPIEAPAPAPAPTEAQPAASAPTIVPHKAKRKLPSHVRPLLTAFVTFVVLFTAFKSPIIFSQLDYFTKKPEPVKVAPAVATVSPDPIIEIPKINVSAPVVYIPTNAEASIQKGLEGGVVHYAGTALPGQKGNTVIVGHSSNDWWEPGNYKFVFVLLDKLVIGDTFTVNYNSQKYVYEVTESKVVEPTELSVLRPTSEPTITLITCTPPGTAWKRLIIKGKQTSPAPNGTAVASKDELKPLGDLPGDSKGLSGTLSDIWNGIVGLFTEEVPADQKTAPGALPGI